jgi:hypothetical protein
MPFWGKRLVSSEGKDSECSSVETVDGTHAQIEKTAKSTNCFDEVVIMQSARLVLETVQGVWAFRKSCSIGEVQSTLRYDLYIPFFACNESVMHFFVNYFKCF